MCSSDLVEDLRQRNTTPHVAQKQNSNIDGRTTRHKGYHTSQKKRKRIEEHFGWLKTVGGMRKARHIGTALVGWMFTLSSAVYNLVRIRNIKMAEAV